MFKTANNNLLKKCVEALLGLFALRYNWSVKKKRRYILYFALELIMETPNYNIEIMSSRSKQTISSVCKNINTVYKKIKKGEDAPKTDYLSVDINTKSNLEKTIEKLDMISNMNSFVPRN
jgi:hypothetical protein